MILLDENKRPWFILQFKRNSHNIANRNLIAQGIKTFLPLHLVTKRIGGKFRNEFKPLFPGYMFVSFDPSINVLSKISNTIGVNRLVKIGNKVIPLPVELINELRERMNKYNGERKQVSVGDKIRIVKGPFSDFIVNVEKIDPEKRIWTLFEFLGRESRLEVTSSDFERI